jgi:hypothetical protein
MPRSQGWKLNPMTSSLPDFSLPASAPAGAPTANAADLAVLGDLATAAPGEFADLIAAPPAAVAPAIPSADLRVTVSVATCVSLVAVPASETAGVEEGTAVPTISRDTMEAAASFLAAVLQSLLPEATPVVPEPSLVGSRLPATGSVTTNSGGPNLTLGASFQAATAVGTLEGPGSAGPRPADEPSLVAPAGAIDGSANAPEAASPVPPYSFEAALAADGAIEIEAKFPAASRDGAARDGESTLPLEIEATLELPGQAILRLAATAALESRAGQPDRVRAKIAATGMQESSSAIAPSISAERNFLTNGKEGVACTSASDGIAVAKPRPAMNAAPTEEIRAPRAADLASAFPAHGQISVAWPSADRTSATSGVSFAQNFAERAVAAVSNVVETQFTASMQKAGSVQLRLRVGDADLAVRVELRNGTVHTNFRTDSADLRAALTREWQAVAAATPEQLRQFVEPVFSSATGGESFSSSSRQHSPQQDQPQRTPRSWLEDALPLNRRESAGEAFASRPAAPRVPVLLPTSLRLSALA